MDILVTLVLFFVGGPVITEVAAHLWHRFIEHWGFLGDKVRTRHWEHHEVNYPHDNLRGDTYRDASVISLYLGVGATVLLLVGFLPWAYSIPLVVSGVIYGWFLVYYFHKNYHITDHWLNKLAWFRNLVKLHDIHHWGPYNYGILMFPMDRLLGTYRTTFPEKYERDFRRMGAKPKKYMVEK